jgi:hypothetical protein
MKLRFDIDVRNLIRQGVDAPKTPVTIEVNPAVLSPEDRDLIASSLGENSIDLYRHFRADDGYPTLRDGKGKLRRIFASKPTLESVLEALREDNDFCEECLAEVRQRLKWEREKKARFDEILRSLSHM